MLLIALAIGVIAWLAVVTVVVGVCMSAAAGDRVRRRPVETQSRSGREPARLVSVG